MNNVIKYAVAILIPSLPLIVNFFNPNPSKLMPIGWVLQAILGALCVYSTTPSKLTIKKFLAFAKGNQDKRKLDLFLSLVVYCTILVLIVLGIQNGILRFFLYCVLWIATLFLAESAQAFIWRKANEAYVMELIEKEKMEAEEQRIRSHTESQSIRDALDYAQSDNDDLDEYEAAMPAKMGLKPTLDSYVEQLIEMRKGSAATSFFLGANQPSNLLEMGEEIARAYGSQGLEYITQQIRVRLRNSHPYDGRELESAWEDIWYRYR